MSHIEEMIRELCPNGVEYKKLKNTTTITRGVRVVKSQLQSIGSYPVYQNSLTPMGYYDKYNCSANTTFIIGAGSAGEIGYSSVDFWAADDCFFFVCPDNLQSRFLYFVLLSQQNIIRSQVRKASIPRLGRAIIENIEIPVPPLAIQNEIVNILDKFTELEAELEAELRDLLQRLSAYVLIENHFYNSAFIPVWIKAKLMFIVSVKQGAQFHYIVSLSFIPQRNSNTSESLKTMILFISLSKRQKSKHKIACGNSSSCSSVFLSSSMQRSSSFSFISFMRRLLNSLIRLLISFVCSIKVISSMIF